MAHVLKLKHVIVAVAAGLACGCAPAAPLAFKQLRYPTPVSYLPLGPGLNVAVTDVGRGEPALVMIHGLGSYSPVWSRNLDELARAHRVVAIDLPGYGKSSKANFDYSMAFYARVVERVIVTLGLGRVVLVGHSMGGQIALTHALQYPARAEALVLVAPAGLERFGRGEGAWLASAVDKELVALTPPETIYANVANNFYAMPDEARFMATDRLRVVGGPDFDAYAYAVSRSVYAMIHEPVIDRLRELRVPALIVFGANDALIPNPILHGGSTRALAEEAVKLMPMGRLEIIPRAGHMVQFERPFEFDRAVLDFLKEVP
jgi:pimeloyl-ACP methyl ester carboxylesterase